MNEDDEPLTGPTDTVKPWTIKAISSEVRDLAITAARRGNVTTGQWLEHVIRAAIADGQQVTVIRRDPPAPPVPADIAAVTGLLNATVAAVTAAAEHPSLAPLARHAIALSNKLTRTARGLPERTRRHPQVTGQTVNGQQVEPQPEPSCDHLTGAAG